jgi:hypothetical protein
MKGVIKGFPIDVRVLASTPSAPSAPDEPKKKKKKKPAQAGALRLTTRIVVTMSGGFPSDGTLRRRGRRALLAGPASGIMTGDRKFDRMIEVRGSVTGVLAHLNDRVRGLALDTIPPHGVIVEKQRVQWDYHGALSRKRLMSGMVKALVSLAVGLKGNGESPEHNLLMNCLRDRNKEVRNVSFSTLMTRFIYKPETHRAAVSLLGGSDPIAEMIGGMQAGEAGLERVRKSAIRPDLPPELRVRCIEHLIREHPARTGGMVVEMIAPIVESLSEKELSSMIKLVELLEPEVAQHGLRPFLTTSSVNVQVAALVALGNVGTDEVIPVIQAVIDEHYVDSKVKVVAKQSIATIRSRTLSIDNP